MAKQSDWGVLRPHNNKCRGKTLEVDSYLSIFFIYMFVYMKKERERERKRNRKRKRKRKREGNQVTHLRAHVYVPSCTQGNTVLMW